MDICLFRMCINFTIPFIILKVKKIPIHIPEKDRFAAFMMALVTLVTFATITFVLPHVKIAVFTAVYATSIFISAFLGWKFNGDRLTAFEIICMFICFGGVLLIALPGQEEDIATLEQTDEQDLIEPDHRLD